jgi:membrane associated rhomboid family serine protease
MRPPPPSDVYKLLFTPPRVVVWLLVCFAGIMGALLVMPKAQVLQIFGTYAFVPATFTNAPWGAAMTPEQVTRLLAPLVTYSFLHASVLHLLMNGIGFLLVATLAARRMGAWSFLAFCLVTGVFAALTHWAFHYDSTTPMVGASGALSGLVGATARFVRLDLRGVWGRAGGLMPLTDRRLIVFTLVWLALNYAFGVSGFGTSGPQQTIAWEAHMGGYFAGVLLFPLFDWREPSRSPDMFVYEEIP